VNISTRYWAVECCQAQTQAVSLPQPVSLEISVCLSCLYLEPFMPPVSQDTFFDSIRGHGIWPNLLLSSDSLELPWQTTFVISRLAKTFLGDR